MDDEYILGCDLAEIPKATDIAIELLEASDGQPVEDFIVTFAIDYVTNLGCRGQYHFRLKACDFIDFVTPLAVKISNLALQQKGLG